MWQDKVIAAVTASFGILLIPQLIDVVYGRATMNPITAFSTATGMLILTVVYSTLKMRMATVTNLFTAIIWFLLGVIGR